MIDRDSNMKAWIKDMAGREKIEAVVIGEMGWGVYNSEEVPRYEEIPKGKVLSWREASKFLDFNFDSGYGSPRCMAVYAWTKSWVIAIGQYDGSTWPFRIPRNPKDCMPEMQGG